MAELQTVFVLQLLFGTFRLCLLQRTSSNLRSVHPGENITLNCDITADYEILWYRQSSEEMKLLVSAGRANKDKHFFFNHNVDEGHYDGIENTNSVSLVIIGVSKTDLGLYYCGGRDHRSLGQFGKAIRLTFAEGDFQSNGSSAQSDSEPRPDPAPCWIINMVLTSVCLVQMSIISLCAFCHRVKAKCCSELHSIEKEVLQFSLHHTAVTTAASEGHTASDLDIMTQIHPPCTSEPFTAVIFEVLNQKNED